MRFYTNPDQPPAPPARRARPSRFGLFLFLMLVYGCFRVLGGMHLHPFEMHRRIAFIAPIVPAPEPFETMSPAWRPLHLNGRPVWGNGTDLDLGDRRTHLPGSILSRFFPDEMILPSCLTEIPPQTAPVAPRLLPVRDDWPGFYGAPWIARLNGNLLVLLNVLAPRQAGLPVPAAQFEIYPANTGGSAAAISLPAPARFYRGSKAVLYRLFLDSPGSGSPARCLDLVVRNGANNGIGRLYYQKYHHYYESDASFVIQQ